MGRSMMDIFQSDVNARGFRVGAVRMGAEKIMVGYLCPDFETKDSRSDWFVEMVRRQVVDMERSNGVLVRCAEYWIGNSLVERWSIK